MPSNIWAIPLDLSNFNVIVAFLGGFISLFGLVSYLIKEHLYLSEACMFLSRVLDCSVAICVTLFAQVSLCLAHR